MKDIYKLKAKNTSCLTKINVMAPHRSVGVFLWDMIRCGGSAALLEDFM